MADAQIQNLQNVPIPSDYVIPGTVEFVLKCVNADFDGSGSTSAWLPTVEIFSDAGLIISRCADQSVSVDAGGDAAVSWFPCVRHRGAGPTPPGTPDCVMIGSGTGDTTLTVTLSSPVPADGVLQLIFGQATGPGPNASQDVASGPSTVTDSQGHTWTVTGTGDQPVIGWIREITLVPDATGQAGSVARECVANDLGVGDTVTVEFDTQFPGMFESCGLLVWQHAWYARVDQESGIAYGNGDDHPSGGPSLDHMSWFEDYGPGTAVPVFDALMITAMGTLPGSGGFNPYEGSLIGEVTGVNAAVAAACFSAPGGADIDPGGTFGGGADQLFGNYQFATPRVFS